MSKADRTRRIALRLWRPQPTDQPASSPAPRAKRPFHLRTSAGHGARRLPLLSVVMPVFNVEPYLADSVMSVLGQTYESIELILIDDGSTDRSGEMCDEFAAKDPRITVIHQANGGLSRARNRGIEAATGDFLAFADSDDLIPKTAYEHLLAALLRTGSDFATGNVRRFDLRKSWNAWNQSESHLATALRTDLTQRPDLIFDLVCWNKVFRRDFVEAIGLTFPVGRLYEDIVPMTRAYVLAESVDVITKTVYEWRLRESGDSITQQRHEIDNMRHKFAEIDRAFQVVLGSSIAGLPDFFVRKVLEGDIWVFVKGIERADETYRAVFEEFLGRYWKLRSTEIVNNLQDKHRIFYAMTQKYGSAVAAQSHHWYLSQAHHMVTTTRGSEVSIDNRKLPADQPRLSKLARVLISGSDVMSFVTSMHWREHKLVLTGWAYLPNIESPESQRITVTARHVASGATVPFSVVRHEAPRAGQHAGSVLYSYAESGFTATLDTASLHARRSTKPLRGPWEFDVTVRGGAVHRTTQFTSFSRKGSIRSIEPIDRDNGIVVVPTTSPRQPLGLSLRKPGLVAADIVIAGRHVRIHVRHRPGIKISSAMLFHAHPQERVVGTHYSLGDGSTLEFTLPAAVTRHNIARRVQVETVDGRTLHITPPLDGSLPRRVPDSTLSAEITRSGWLTIHDHPTYAIIDSVEYLGDFRVRVAGWAHGKTDLEFALHLTNSAGSTWQHLPVDEGHFELVADLGYRDWYGTRRPMKAGTHTISVRGRGDAELDRAWRLHCDKALPATFPRRIEDPLAHLQIESGTNATLQLKLEAPIPLADRGLHARHALRAEYDENATVRPEDSVFLNCDIGNSAHGNVLAIYEELRARNTDLRVYWGVADHSVPIPPGAIPVVKFSRDWYAQLAGSRYLVNDYGGIEGYADRAHQRYLQTWHGTPYKFIGRSQVDHQLLGRDEGRIQAEEGSHWDLLLSLSPYYSDLVPSELGYAGTVLESGSPRNDALVTTSDESRAHIRERLGIPRGKKVLLYAPTFRDYLREGWGAVPFRGLDVDGLARFLGPEWIIIVRGHSFNARYGGDLSYGAQVIDATDHLEINHLYIASDVLLTDYSSAMFDYSLTGRPILGFIPDLEQYIDSRGAYLDLAEIAPGPLCTNEDELREAFTKLDDYDTTYGAEYGAFRKRFTPWDDGNASRRVVDAFFGADAGE